MNYKEIQETTILALLPHNEYTQLINKKQKLDALHFLKAIVNLSIKGLEQFIQGNLYNFDAQLGENLCQIRAYKIVFLWNKISRSYQLKKLLIFKINSLKLYQKKLNIVADNFEECIDRSIFYVEHLDSPEIIDSFLGRIGLFLKLDEEIVFVIYCYFLTCFNIRNENIPIAINLDLISKDLGISKNRAKRLTHKYQKNVCTMGCDFVMKISNKLCKNLSYNQILKKLYQVSDEDRAVLPCYIVSEIIFYHIIKDKTPIFLRVNRKDKISKKVNDVVYFILAGYGGKEHLYLASCEDHIMNCCIVISGDMEYDKLENPKKYAINFLQKNPLKIILSNTATHPQYSGKKLFEYRDDPFLLLDDKDKTTSTIYHKKKLIDMKKFAVDTGCTKENQSIFFLRHIYASQVSIEINKLKRNYSFNEAYKMVVHEEFVH